MDLPGLIRTLVRTDFKARYHGTVAGFFWALLKPTAMFVVLMSVFSFVFSQTPGYRLDLVVGLFLWDFFGEGTKVGLLSLQARSFLLTRARFPRWILVATSLSNPLVTLATFSGAFLAWLAASGRWPGAMRVSLFLAYLVAYLLVVLAFSLATSGLFLRYRDLNQVWEVVAQAGFFLAPVIYPLGILPEKVHFWLYLWPPTVIIEFSRMVLVHGDVPSARAHLLLGLLVGFCLVVGIFLFRALSPRAAEYL